MDISSALEMGAHAREESYYLSDTSRNKLSFVIRVQKICCKMI